MKGDVNNKKQEFICISGLGRENRKKRDFQYK